MGINNPSLYHIQAQNWELLDAVLDLTQSHSSTVIIRMSNNPIGLIVITLSIRC